MNSKIILHSPIAINYAKFLNHHMLLGVFGNKEENKRNLSVCMTIDIETEYYSNRIQYFI